MHWRKTVRGNDAARLAGALLPLAEAMEARRLLSAAPFTVRPAHPVSVDPGTAVQQPLAIVRGDAPQPDHVYQLNIDWGDGTTISSTVPATRSLGPHALELSALHTYASGGVYHISTEVIADGTLIGTATETIHVRANSRDGQTVHAAAGRSFTGVVAEWVGSPADGGYTIAWGDGADSSAEISQRHGRTFVTGTHTYVAAGSYTITTLPIAATGPASLPIISNAIVLAAKGGKSSAAAVKLLPVMQLTANELTNISPAELLHVPQSLTSVTATYEWGDGATSTSEPVNLHGTITAAAPHQYAGSGNYRLLVTFRDGSRILGSSSQIISVGVNSPVGVGITWGDGTRSLASVQSLGNGTY